MDARTIPWGLALALTLTAAVGCTPDGPAGLEDEAGAEDSGEAADEIGTETATEDESSTEDSSDTTSSTEGGDPVCGDGVVEGAEQCDDGDLVDGDGCNSQCLPSGLELSALEVPKPDPLVHPLPSTLLEDGTLAVPMASGSDAHFVLYLDADGELVSSVDFDALGLDNMVTDSVEILADGSIVLRQHFDLFEDRLVEISAAGEVVRMQPSSISELAHRGQVWTALDGGGVVIGSLDDLFTSEPAVIATLPEEAWPSVVEVIDAGALVAGGLVSEPESEVRPAYWIVTPEGEVSEVSFEFQEENRWFQGAAVQGDAFRLVTNTRESWDAQQGEWSEGIKSIVPVPADGGWYVYRGNVQDTVEKHGPSGELWYTIVRNRFGDPDFQSIVGTVDGLELLTFEAWGLGQSTAWDLVRYGA